MVAGGGFSLSKCRNHAIEITIFGGVADVNAFVRLLSVVLRMI